MYKTIACLALSLFASLTAACVAVPMDENDARDEAPALEEASVHPGKEAPAVKQSGTTDLVCPGAGTCAKADYNCFNYGTMCDVALKCEQCYGSGVAR